MGQAQDAPKLLERAKHDTDYVALGAIPSLLMLPNGNGVQMLEELAQDPGLAASTRARIRKFLNSPLGDLPRN